MLLPSAAEQSQTCTAPHWGSKSGLLPYHLPKTVLGELGPTFPHPPTPLELKAPKSGGVHTYVKELDLCLSQMLTRLGVRGLGLSVSHFPVCKTEIIVPTSFYSVMINKIPPIRPGYLVTLIVGHDITVVVAAAIIITIIITIAIIFIITLVNQTNQSLLIFSRVTADVFGISPEEGLILNANMSKALLIFPKNFV